MPINNIKNIPEVMYMKINNIAGKNLEDLKNIKEAKKRENVTNKIAPPKQELRTKNTETVRLASQKMIEKAVKKTGNMPEIREEKVAQIKAQVQEGTYNVSNREIARSMIGNLLNEIA